MSLRERWFVAHMFGQQAGKKAGVQPWCVKLIDGNLWRPKRVNEAFDGLINLCVKSGRHEPRTFWI